MKNNKTFLFIISFFLIGYLFQPQNAFSETAKHKYIQADAAYKNLRHNPRKQKYREFWFNCIKKYEAVFHHDPSDPWAPAGMYQSGILYYELYKRSYKPADKQEALDVFERVIKRYPKSQYAKRSANQIREITKKPYTPPVTVASNIKHFKKNDTLTKKDLPPPLPEKPAKPPVRSAEAYSQTTETTTVEELRFWSNPNYTRIVIDADRETTFTNRLLNKDPSINKPQRLLVDLNHSRLGKDLSKFVPINDELLKNARAGQYKPDTVRVVIDIKSFKNYKIFSLKNPFRIVIDVWGDESNGIYASKNRGSSKIPHSAIAKQLALGVSRIVIDPGHGGKDYGAPGYLKGVHERDIVLKLANKLSQKIERELKCETILTRTSNKFLTLEERTAFANIKKADLFISLHTNASRNRKAYGIETYFLNLATDDESIMLAAKENATSTKNISDLQDILSDLMQNAKINESSRLATHVQESMHSNLRKKYSRIRNKGVKQAPFYVLLGAQMPAILIETGFISNAGECKRLISPSYQDKVCDAIVDGIKQYIQETNPTAFMDSHPVEKGKS